jgi:hypothetical protein
VDANMKKKFLILIVYFLCTITYAFQIAPNGSIFEAKLTKESDSNLYFVAGKVGVLLKAPVHEEITRLAYGCPVEDSLQTNKTCASENSFVTPYVIYGVRWNDLPPFRLDVSSGNCQFLGVNTCKPETVRFSTQPLCWYCLFADAQKKAEKSKISLCEKGPNIIRGNLMTRSHFGDLQFLHSMATEPGESPEITQQKILGWLELAWRVSTGEISASTFLRDVNIPALKPHFGCSGWRVADIYILGRQGGAGKPGENLTSEIRDIAFGSVLHTVQDSFASGHTFRDSSIELNQCIGVNNIKVPRIKEFHSYAAQDGKKHDESDSRDALISGTANEPWPFAVEASRQLVKLRKEDNRLPWSQVKNFMQCLFELTPEPNSASAGLQFTK